MIFNKNLLKVKNFSQLCMQFEFGKQTNLSLRSGIIDLNDYNTMRVQFLSKFNRKSIIVRTIKNKNKYNSIKKLFSLTGKVGVSIV